MKNNVQNNECREHNEEFVLIDINPTCGFANRHLCPKCLTKYPNQLRVLKTYTEANKIFVQAKKKFKSEKENQRLKNLQCLEEMATRLQTINNNLNELINNLQEIINHQYFYSEYLDQKLEEIDIDSYLSSDNEFSQPDRNIEAIQNIIEKQLISLQQLISLNLQTLKQIDIKQLKLIPEVQVINNFICPQHNKEIEFFDLHQNTPREQRITCQDCLRDKLGKFINIETIRQQWEELQCYRRQFNILEIENKNIEILNKQIKELRDEYDNQVNQILDDNSKHFNNFITQTKNFFNLTYEELLEDLDILSQPNYLEDLQTTNQYFMDESNKKIKKLTQNALIKLSKIEKKYFGQGSQHICQNDPEKKRISIQHQIINMTINGPVAQLQEIYEQCQAISISQDSSTVIVGFGLRIKVFTFQNGALTPMSTILEHGSIITCLYFMKNQDIFISAAQDGTMIIWNQLRVQEQHIVAHQNSIKSIIMNNKEDLIVSCSIDSSIKFWKKKQKWECDYILNEHRGPVYNMDFNQSTNILVSCGQSKPTLIHRYKCQIILTQMKNSKWSILQIIWQKEIVKRICFVGENIFIFQSQKGGILNVFQKSHLKNQFTIIKQISIEKSIESQDMFPVIYNYQKQIVVMKQGKKVFLIKKNNDLDFTVQYILSFNTEIIVGTTTNNGQYLILWDAESKRITVKNQM